MNSFIVDVHGKSLRRLWIVVKEMYSISLWETQFDMALQ